MVDLNLWLGNVIEHEGLVRVPIYKTDSLFELTFEDQYVVNEVVRLECLNAAIECFAFEKAIGLSLHDVTHGLELVSVLIAIEHFSDIRICEWHPADYTFDEVVRICLFE